jgi:hypothetical protein
MELFPPLYTSSARIVRTCYYPLEATWNYPFFVEGEDSNQGGTGRHKQSQIQPDSRRCHCTSMSRAKALEGADFHVHTLYTTGQDQLL